jgi:hypothetical protein
MKKPPKRHDKDKHTRGHPPKDQDRVSYTPSHDNFSLF